MNPSTVDRRWLLRRLLDIESMGTHTGRALRELIEELGDGEAVEPELVSVSRKPFLKRALAWQCRRR